jgi:hypothetical protein
VEPPLSVARIVDCEAVVFYFSKSERNSPSALPTENLFLRSPEATGGADFICRRWMKLGVVFLVVVSNFQNAKHFPSRGGEMLRNPQCGRMPSAPPVASGALFYKNYLSLFFEKYTLEIETK